MCCGKRKSQRWDCSTKCLFILLVLFVILPLNIHSETQKPDIYHNEFAVHIKGGLKVANQIAQSNGFENAGQIGTLDDHYLFRHSHVHKRSTTLSKSHHDVLQSEPEVLWFEQQKEIKRKKRDLKVDEKASSIHDPLFRKQWFINGGAYDGTDMNVIPAWQKGITGKGVVVTILDDGIQHDHPDLKQNYDPGASTDINGNDGDPMPQDNGDNKHGTRCAGEVAAVAFNEYCGVGIAYNSSIGGVRMLDGMVNDAVEARALSLNPQHIDIYSASWGPEDDGKTVDGPGPLAKKAFEKGIKSGRGGKGSIFVWASGNGGRKTDNCNCDGYTNSPYTLSISSATQGGRKPWYLEECSSTLATTYSSGTPSHDASITTVDQDKRLRPDKICTSSHTGTSASAPIAAGICALVLEVNKQLTWRDMQHIVLQTANPRPLLHEDGWKTNGVGRKYSHKFGYGLMDAAAMVNLAENWKPIGSLLKCQSEVVSPKLKIPASPDEFSKISLSVDDCNHKSDNQIKYLEHVQCIVSLKSVVRGAIKINLVSPQGTRSSLLLPRPKDHTLGSFDEWPFMSVHFWGESPEGDWTLEVGHNQQIHGEAGNIVRKVQLVIYGTESLSQLKDGTASYIQRHHKYSNMSYNLVDKESPKSQHTSSKLPSTYLSYNYEYQNEGDNALMVQNRNKTGEVCKNGVFNYRSSSCVLKCPDDTYQTFDRSCQPCSQRCGTCYGPMSGQCNSCKLDTEFAYYIQDKSRCYRKCPKGYFQQTQRPMMAAVNSGSREPVYEYALSQENDFKFCEQCPIHCASCENENKCTSCNGNLILYNHTCISDCPIGRYAKETKSIDGNRTFICDLCHKSCDTCIGPKGGQCARCKKGFFYYQRSCIQSCPTGFAADRSTGECIPCPQGCEVCTHPIYHEESGTFHQLCTQCEKNWKLIGDPSMNPESHPHQHVKCVPISSKVTCDKSCATCFKGGNSGCVTCNPGHVLHIDSCSDHCPPSTYFLSSISNSSIERQLTTIDDMLLGECRHCPHTCKTCETPMRCQTCQNGYFLRSKGSSNTPRTMFETECVPSCGDGYYTEKSQPGVCLKCDARCETCKTKDYCLSCTENFVLSQNGSCVTECPSGYVASVEEINDVYEEMEDEERRAFPYLECNDCHGSCTNCSGPGFNECLSCKPGLGYDVATKSCHSCDPGRYFHSTKNQCQNCHIDCDLCHGPNIEHCDKCKLPLARDKWNKTCVRCCESSQETLTNKIKTATLIVEEQTSTPSSTKNVSLKATAAYCCQCDKHFNCINPAYEDRGEDDASGKRSIFIGSVEMPSMVSASRKTLMFVTCLVILAFFAFVILKRWKRIEKRRRGKSQVNGKRKQLSNELAKLFSFSRRKIKNGGNRDSRNGDSYVYSQIPTSSSRNHYTMGSLADIEDSEDSESYEDEVEIRNGKRTLRKPYINGNEGGSSQSQLIPSSNSTQRNNGNIFEKL